MDLVEILASMTTEEGLSLALVVGRDGIVIEGQSRGSSVDLQSIGAMASRSLAEFDRLGKALSSGTTNHIRLRFENAQLLIETLSQSDVLVAGVSDPRDGERLLNAVARYRAQLQQLLGEM